MSADWPTNTAHNKQRELFQTTGLKEKAVQYNTRAHASHIEDTPEVPVFGKQETLHGRALQDCFFIKPLLSSAGDAATFPNIES